MLRLLLRFALTGLLLSGIAALAVVVSTATILPSLDIPYFPSRTSMQAHVDQLSQHVLRRLCEPPLAVLPTEVVPDTSFPRDMPSGPTLGLPPHLSHDGLTPRTPVIWSQRRGWLSDTPRADRERLDLFFAGMAGNDEWSQPALTQAFVDYSDPYDPVFAGTWVLRDNDLFFRGALTPQDAFFRDYLPLWVDEYRATLNGSLLDLWMWQPAELTYVPGDSSRAPLVLMPSQAADLSSPDRGKAPPKPVMTLLERLMNTSPDWRASATPVTARIYPLSDTLELRTPFLTSAMIVYVLRVAAWWAMGVFLIALIALSWTWLGRPRR